MENLAQQSGKAAMQEQRACRKTPHRDAGKPWAWQHLWAFQFQYHNSQRVRHGPGWLTTFEKLPKEHSPGALHISQTPVAAFGSPGWDWHRTSQLERCARHLPNQSQWQSWCMRSLVSHSWRPQPSCRTEIATCCKDHLRTADPPHPSKQRTSLQKVCLPWGFHRSRQGLTRELLRNTPRTLLYSSSTGS